MPPQAHPCYLADIVYLLIYLRVGTKLYETVGGSQSDSTPGSCACEAVWDIQAARVKTASAQETGVSLTNGILVKLLWVLTKVVQDVVRL